MEPIDEVPINSPLIYFFGATTNGYLNAWCGSTFNTIYTSEPVTLKKDEVKLLGDKLKELKK